MSGTIASRFQGRFGYAPGLRVSAYPGMDGVGLPSLPLTPPAPAAPAAETPVSAGSQTPAAQQPAAPGAMGEGDGYSATPPGMGPNPGTLGSSFGSGFGAPSYGQIGGVLGTLAGVGLGVPGLGLVGTALGTDYDVREANGRLQTAGLAPEMSFMPAFTNNLTMGLAGQSIPDQMAAQMPHAATHLNAVESAMGGWDVNTAPSPHAQQHMNAVDAMMSGLDFTNASGGDGGVSASDIGGGQEGLGEGFGQSASEFMEGGYTGAGHDGEVQPTEPAGTVHEGEVVIPADMVEHYGLSFLMGLVNGEIPRSRLRDLAGMRD